MCEDSQQGIDSSIFKDENYMTMINVLHSLAKMNFTPLLKNLSQSEFLVLFFVKKFKEHHSDGGQGINVSSIAAVMEVSSPAVSRTLNSLEEKQYITRTIDKSNRRNIFVSITEQGKEAYKSDSKIISDVSCGIIEKMGKEQFDTLIELSLKLSKIINQEVSHKLLKKAPGVS